jgi:aryl-alcohol dehydrogenase-like predicted oxidoreductase
MPEGARYNTDQPLWVWLSQKYVGKTEESQKAMVAKWKKLGELASELGCTQAQLSLAWTLKNNDVSTSIIGASKKYQMEDNLGAMKIYKKWTPEIEAKIEAWVEFHLII